VLQFRTQAIQATETIISPLVAFYFAYIVSCSSVFALKSVYLVNIF